MLYFVWLIWYGGHSAGSARKLGRCLAALSRDLGQSETQGVSCRELRVCTCILGRRRRTRNRSWSRRRCRPSYRRRRRSSARRVPGSSCFSVQIWLAW